MSTSYDVIVIGGGALGSACARELALEGRRVLVLERGGDLGQAWRAAAGMLAPEIAAGEYEPLYELSVASRERYAELATQLGAALPVSALAAQLESGLIAQGHADDDMSALARAIRGLSGLDD